MICKFWRRRSQRLKARARRGQLFQIFTANYESNLSEIQRAVHASLSINRIDLRHQLIPAAESFEVVYFVVNRTLTRTTRILVDVKITNYRELLERRAQIASSSSDPPYLRAANQALRQKHGHYAQ